MRLLFISLAILILNGCQRAPSKLSTAQYKSLFTSDEYDQRWEEQERKLQSLPNINERLIVYPKRTYLTQLDWNKGIGNNVRSEVEAFLKYIYNERNYSPIWINKNGKDVRSQLFLAHVASVESHGISPERYRLNDFENKIRKHQQGTLSVTDKIELELDMTRYYLLMSHDLLYGVSRPMQQDGTWIIVDDRIITPLDLATVKSKKDIKKYYKSIMPKAFAYSKMIKYLAKFQTIAKENSWTDINLSDKETIELGDKHDLVPLIRQRLYTLNELIGSTKVNEDKSYDYNLNESVKLFQEHRGLVSDGIVGSGTIKELNVKPDELVKKIKLNLERMRWLPVVTAQNYLWVNIPSYQLSLYKKSKYVFGTKVIVGTEENATPVFTDTLQYLVFSPTWIIPLSIKGEEMLPRLQANASYYSKGDYNFYEGWSTDEEKRVNPIEIDWNRYTETNFPFNIVQQPGKNNALGLVKFIMPNDMSIYLHDTPANHKFNAEKRAFSHGCIRVEEPAMLAQYLLDDRKNWSYSKIQEAMHQEEPQKVHLKNLHPVHITYLTAFVDDNGVLNFRDDIYGFDHYEIGDYF